MKVGVGINNLGLGLGLARYVLLGDPWTNPIYILKSGDTWYKREINSGEGYFALWYSSNAGSNWEFLFDLDLTEDSVVIDLTHQYRHRIVGTQYMVDQTLTETGYLGIEDVDWENIYST